MARTSKPITPEQLTVVPANEAWWDDLEARVGLAITRQRRTPVIYQAHRFRKKGGP
jgi:hypothetical protein